MLIIGFEVKLQVPKPLFINQSIFQISCLFIIQNMLRGRYAWKESIAQQNPLSSRQTSHLKLSANYPCFEVDMLGKSLKKH